MCYHMIFFFFKQKTAYEMRISDWSSDVCSSDFILQQVAELVVAPVELRVDLGGGPIDAVLRRAGDRHAVARHCLALAECVVLVTRDVVQRVDLVHHLALAVVGPPGVLEGRSEEHTSELQSLMRISYAVLCLQKQN